MKRRKLFGSLAALAVLPIPAIWKAKAEASARVPCRMTLHGLVPPRSYDDVIRMSDDLVSAAKDMPVDLPMTIDIGETQWVALRVK